MEKEMFHKLTIFMMFLAFAPTSKCQFFLPPQPPRPLCASQFALVDHACEMLPYSPLPPPSPIPTPPSPPGPSPPDDDKERHEHGHEHGHEHEHRHRHKHGHRHGHKHGYHTTPVEDNCCRWLKEVDNDCVCDLLVHLPAFLARPAHSYRVQVGAACSVSYQCAGRLRA